MHSSKICGFEARTQLRNIYESFYGQNDQTLTSSHMKPDPVPTHAPTAPTSSPTVTVTQPTEVRIPKVRVSNFTSHLTTTPTPPSTSQSSTISQALTPAHPQTVTLPSVTTATSDTSLVIHQGRSVNIIELVQQLVTEQVAPLRRELQSHADKQVTLQRQLLIQHISDQEQLFLRVKSEYKKGLRDLQQLRRDKAKYPERSQEAQDLEGYILQDQKDLEAQLDNLKYIYAETIQEANSNHIPLSTLTGDAAKDF